MVRTVNEILISFVILLYAIGRKSQALFTQHHFTLQNCVQMDTCGAPRRCGILKSRAIGKKKVYLESEVYYMKTRKLRLLSALLALAMLLALLPTAAFADTIYGTVSGLSSGTCGAEGDGSNVTWKLENGTLTISGNGKIKDTSENNLPWPYPNKIKKVIVENGVTEIGCYDFYNCTNLTEVDLSNVQTLENIRENAFSDCSSLSTVKLPMNGKLKSIDTNAFGFLKGVAPQIREIMIPASVKEIRGHVFNGCKQLENVEFAEGSKLETIYWNVFESTSLKKITIPASVTTIEFNAFRWCEQLKSVTFAPGSKLETIGKMAFEDTAISEISIPASVKTIGNYVFKDCLKLTKVIFESPSKLNDVNEYAFMGCSTTIYGDDNVMSKLSGKVDANKIKPANPTVTFDFDNGTEAENKQVENGEKVTPPTAPTKEDYIFAGWYTKDANDKWADKPFDFSKAVTDDMTLYARWEKLPDHQLTVIGGTFAVKDETIETETKDDAVIANIPVDAEVTVAFNKEAYADSNQTFGGWVIEGLDDAENYTNQETFTFTMPQNGVRIEAMTKFADVEDSGWDAATVVTGVAIGTGTAILAYHIGMKVYAEQVLGKDVAVPRTRAEVALLAWQLAGSPAVNMEGEPLSKAAQAERWAVESGLMQNDAQGNFNGTKKMSKWNALRTLEKAKQ